MLMEGSAVFPKRQLADLAGGEAEDDAVADGGREVETSVSAASAFPAGVTSSAGS